MRASRVAVPEDSPQSGSPFVDPYARPAAPALDLGSASREAAAPSSPPKSEALPERLSLRALGDSWDPLLAPEKGPVEAAASAARQLLEDDCPPTVRTPRHAPMGAVETLPAVAEGQTAVPAVASTMVAAGSDDVPAELRVSDVEAGFFRFDSFPPVVEDLLEEPESEADEPPPSPELLARRARLRKAVGAVVAAFATLAVVAGAVGAFRSGGPGPMAAATMAGVPHEQAVVPQSKLVAPKPKRAVAASPGATSTGSAEQLRDPAALRLRAVALLSAHELDEAAAVGREIIALEPDHAFGYRCLGAALQDQGKWSEALDVYGACAGRAKRGEVGECVALGGRR